MLTKDLLLSKIYKVDERFREQAYQILESDQLIEKESPSAELKLFEIKGELNYEVEILVRKRTIKEYSCECKDFLQQGECAHILAAALKVFNIGTVKKEVKPKPKKERSLSLGQVLRSVEAEELRQFIKDYAKRDKRIINALKARFARNIDSRDGIEKYRHVIRQAGRLYSGREGKISAYNQRNLNNILLELTDQLQNCLDAKDYSEASAIIIAVLREFCGRLLPGLPLVESLDRNISKVIGLIPQIYNDHISPELKTNIWNETFHLIENKLVLGASSRSNLLSTLIYLADDRSKAIHSMEFLSREIKESEELHDIGTLLMICNQLNHRFDLNLSCVEQLVQRDGKDILETLSTLKLKGQLNLMRDVLEQLALTNHFLLLDKRLSEFTYFLALNVKDYKSMIQITKDRLLAGGGLRYYKLLKKDITPSWKRYYKRLIKWIALEERLGVQLRAEILKFEEEFDLLIELIKKAGSINLWIAYYESIESTGNPIPFYKILGPMVSNYLDEHFGQKATTTAMDLINFLKNRNRPLYREIMSLIRSEYLDRTYLIKELNNQ